MYRKFIFGPIFQGLLQQVTNSRGISHKTPCSCGNWFKHWESYSLVETSKCANIECENLAATGVHVIKCESEDSQEYVVPLCHECDTQQDPHFFVGKDMLVKAIHPKCQQFLESPYSGTN